MGRGEDRRHDIRTVADLERLPLTHKSELMADPESFRLSAARPAAAERALWEIIYTTGSTADPTPIYNTTHDYNAYLFQSRGSRTSRTFARPTSSPTCFP